MFSKIECGPRKWGLHALDYVQEGANVKMYMCSLVSPTNAVKCKKHHG